MQVRVREETKITPLNRLNCFSVGLSQIILPRAGRSQVCAGKLVAELSGQELRV